MKSLPIVNVVLGVLAMPALIATPSVNAQLRPTPQQFPVSLAAVADTVVSTLAARGIQVSAEQVKLPLNVLATEESPLFEVGAIEKLGRLGTSQPGQMSASIKLKCKLAASCRPFFAIATWSEDAQTQQASASTVKTVAAASIIARAKADQLTLSADKPKTLIKAGQPLTMLVEDDHMHIQMAVVSLASASAGQKIRVSSPDHKRFYMAEVLDASTVKGTI